MNKRRTKADFRQGAILFIVATFFSVLSCSGSTAPSDRYSNYTNATGPTSDEGVAQGYINDSICAQTRIPEFDDHNPMEITRRHEKASFEELKIYLDSDNAIVRIQVVRDLRVYIDALVDIKSTASIPVLNRAMVGSSNPDERAKLREAIAKIGNNPTAYPRRNN